MPVFKVIDRPDPDAPDRAQGWVMADSEAEARAVVSAYLPTEARPLFFSFETKIWPGPPGTPVWWCTPLMR